MSHLGLCDKREIQGRSLDFEGVLRIKGRICEPIVPIFHTPRCDKYVHDLSQYYWWCGMKKDISKKSTCLTFQ